MPSKGKCSTEGCETSELKDGLCFKHFKAKYGRVPYPCKYPDCKASAQRGGLCGKHLRSKPAEDVAEPEESEPIERAPRPTVIADRRDYMTALKERRAQLMLELSIVNTSIRVAEEFTR